MEQNTSNMSLADFLSKNYDYLIKVAKFHDRNNYEDLLQSAFLKICEAGYCEVNRTLFYTTIRNLYINEFRRRQVLKFVSLDTADEIGKCFIPDFEASDMVDSVLATGSELALMVSGYKCREIAVLEGVEPTTIRTRIFNQRKTLLKDKKVENYLELSK